MAEDLVFRSQYHRRVTLVQDTLKTNAKLSDKAALDLATRVLNALDKTRETIR